MQQKWRVVRLFSQNALPSDDDDKDPNDPHKALDIDLDKYVYNICCLPCVHLLFILIIYINAFKFTMSSSSFTSKQPPRKHIATPESPKSLA